MDKPAPNASESTGDVLSALANYYPELMQVYNGQVQPTSQTQLDTAKSISPQYQELLSNLYKTYAPGLAQTGSNIDAQTRLNTANTDAQILAGPGKDIATGYAALDKSLNPEYYATRASTGNAINTLLDATGNLNKPNIEAERLVGQENARTGNLGNTSATNTVSNALQFGNENTKRTNNLASAIQTATGFLPAANNTAFNAATTALNKPTSNTGVSQFGGVTPASTQSYSSGQGLLGSVTGLTQNAQNINANNRDVLDRINGSVSSL